MKKILLLILVATLSLGLTACGGDTASSGSAATPAAPEANLVDVTSDAGLTMKLPAGMVVQPNPVMYMDSANGEIATILSSDLGDVALTEYKEEDIVGMLKVKYTDAKGLSFDNAKKIDGKDALVCKMSFTTTQGNPVIHTVVMVTDGTKNYVVSLTNGTDDTDGPLVKNMQACIDSIKIK